MPQSAAPLVDRQEHRRSEKGYRGHGRHRQCLASTACDRPRTKKPVLEPVSVEARISKVKYCYRVLSQHIIRRPRWDRCARDLDSCGMTTSTMSSIILIPSGLRFCREKDGQAESQGYLGRTARHQFRASLLRRCGSSKSTSTAS